MGILSLYFNLDHKKENYAVAAVPRQVTRERMIRRLGWRCEPAMKDWLRRQIAALTPAKAKAKAKRTSPTRRAGRSARAPAASGDDGDGDGDGEPESQHPASKKHLRFFHRNYPGAPTREQLKPWEEILRNFDDCQSATEEPGEIDTRKPSPDVKVKTDAGDGFVSYETMNPVNGIFSAVDHITKFRNFHSDVVADLIDAEDATAITPAAQVRLDRAAKAKAKADADRLKRQRLAVLAACDNPQQRLVFELLCGGATAEEAAATAGYASATVVTKMISRWKKRAGKGRIAVGFEQLDLFGGAA